PIAALIKPQFEVGRGEVGKGGVVREQAKRLAVVETICEWAAAHGFTVAGTVESPVRGPAGNIEYFVLLWTTS
ncbi:MAG: SAM-dependent methyltransferase, partial [Pseudomonadota bacterium]